MKMNAEIFAAFSDFCERSGIKRTAQRCAVFAAVYGSRAHPSAEEVFGRVKKTLPTIKLESVYRILGNFHRAGLIKRVHLSGLSRFDSNTSKHAHFVCSKCGKIADIPMPELKLPPSLRGAEEVSMTLGGLCPVCAVRVKSKRA